MQSMVQEIEQKLLGFQNQNIENQVNFEDFES